MDVVASLGCVVCRRDSGVIAPCHVHHIAEGSSKRSDFMVAGLCHYHHVSPYGLHGMGVRAFLSANKLPTEYHLIELVNKYRAEDRV